MQILRLIKMVLWGFFGVRKRAGLETDLTNGNPIHIIAIGILAAAVFIGILIMLVNTALQVLT